MLELCDFFCIKNLVIPVGLLNYLWVSGLQTQ